MTTARFQSVIAAAGKPEQHLLWTKPAQDKTLQKALKENRVMTLHQSAVGSKADYGTIGLEKAAQGQILIFPKSLKAFEGNRVVGVNYDLFAEAPVQQTAKPKKKPRAQPKKPEKKTAPKANIVPFPTTEEEPAESEEPDCEDIIRKVRRAMKALEQGKQVAAHAILKEIVGD